MSVASASALRITEFNAALRTLNWESAESNGKTHWLGKLLDPTEAQQFF